MYIYVSVKFTDTRTCHHCGYQLCCRQHNIVKSCSCLFITYCLLSNNNLLPIALCTPPHG